MKWLNPLDQKASLKGETKIPSDKSIAQRSIMLASIAQGMTEIRNFPLAGDPQSTLAAFEKLGVKVEKESINENSTVNLKVFGQGINGLTEPQDVLNFDNSGTGMRLTMGLLAGLGRPFFAALTGDASLRSRPMKRITEPLKNLGAQIWGRENAARAPISLLGSSLKGGSIITEVASAQLKSALLLSCLNAESALTVKEPAASRNHTEIMLKQFGAKIESLDELTVKLYPSELKATELLIPGDISSAAFLLVAGSLVPESEITIANIGLNPTRTGIVDILQKMGADLMVEFNDSSLGEPTGKITVKAKQLNGIEIGGSIIPNIIDELPIISLAAALAKGTTIIKDAEELRVKESDRLKAVTTLLLNLGVEVEEKPDGLIIQGRDGKPFEPKNVSFDSKHDHRIAMTVGIASLLCTKPICLEGAEWANVSFPGFFNLLKKLTTEKP